MNDELENVPLTAEELALARRWAISQSGRPSTRTDTQPLSRRKSTILIYRLLATIDRYEAANHLAERPLVWTYSGKCPKCGHVIEAVLPALPSKPADEDEDE